MAASKKKTKNTSTKAQQVEPVEPVQVQRTEVFMSCGRCGHNKAFPILVQGPTRVFECSSCGFPKTVNMGGPIDL